MEEQWYAWQVFDEDGRWGIIAAAVVALSSGPVPLVTRSREVAGEWQPLALGHHEQTGKPIRLAVLAVSDVLEQHGEVL